MIEYAKCLKEYEPKSYSDLFVFSEINVNNNQLYVADSFALKEYRCGVRRVYEILEEKYRVDLDGLYDLAINNLLLDYEQIVLMVTLPKVVFPIEDIPYVLAAFEKFNQVHSNIRLQNVTGALRGFIGNIRVKYLCINSYGRKIFDKNELEGALTGDDFCIYRVDSNSDSKRLIG